GKGSISDIVSGPGSQGVRTQRGVAPHDEKDVGRTGRAYGIGPAGEAGAKPHAVAASKKFDRTHETILVFRVGVNGNTHRRSKHRAIGRATDAHNRQEVRRRRWRWSLLDANFD